MYLEDDLQRIGCIGLMSKLWSIKDKKMVREVIIGVPNQYDLIVHR